MFGSQAMRAVIGIAIADYSFMAFVTSKIFYFFYKFFHFLCFITANGNLIVAVIIRLNRFGSAKSRYSHSR